MGIKKPSSLKIAFWRFLFMLLVGLFGAVAIPFLLVTVSTTLGLTTYGDYSEIRANELAPILAATPDLSDVQIPMGIEYALLDKNYQLIETTLDENELEQAMRYATTGASDQNLQKRYLLVTRENEYVVLQYYIGAQYTNEWMNEHLPSPDILLIVLIAAGGILVCLLLTTRFAKKLRLQLVPLFEATSEVAKQNLDFEVGHSNIKEFEDVLISFSHMKESLKASLEQQWKAEQMQKEQIAALAHDLKTPLTVISANNEMQEIINEKPDNFLPWAIVSTVLCCLPFGIVAIVYASKVDTLWYAQKQAEAVHAAKQARTWTFVSIGTGLFFVLMYLFFMGTVLSLGLNM